MAEVEASELAQSAWQEDWSPVFKAIQRARLAGQP